MTTVDAPLETIVRDLMFAAANYADLDQDAILRATSNILGRATELSGFTQAEMSVITEERGAPPPAQEYRSKTLHVAGFGSYGMSEIATDFFNNIKPVPVSALSNSPAYVLGTGKPIHIYDDPAYVRAIEQANGEYFRPIPVEVMIHALESLKKKNPEKVQGWQDDLRAHPEHMANFYASRLWAWENKCPLFADFEGVTNFSEFMSGLVMPVMREYKGDKQALGFIVFSKPDPDAGLGFNPSIEPIPQERVAAIQHAVNLLGLPIQTVAAALANRYLIDQVNTQNDELKQAYKDLEAAQAQIVRSETLAAMGRHVSRIAHDFNTPLGSQRGYLDIIRSETPRMLEHERGLATSLPQDQYAMYASLIRELDGTSRVEIESSELRSTLRERGIRISRAQAQELAEIGIFVGENLELLAGLLENPDSREAIIQGLSGYNTIVHASQEAYTINDAQQAMVNQLGGKPEKKRANISINDCVARGVSMSQAMNTRSINIHQELGDLLEGTVAPMQIASSVMNLLTNVYKLRSSTYANVTLAKEDRKGTPYAVISVEDDGEGIPPEELTKIFEPNYSRSELDTSSGQGLTITWKYMELHGGTVEVDSEVGRGSTFRLAFPIQ